MQALLLATGEQNKLLPLTKEITPPMLPIVDRPVMVRAVELLARHGFTEATVSLQRGASAVEQYFGRGRRWGVDLQYVLQREEWGTAGSLKWAEGVLDKPFVVIPADVLIDVDLERLVAQHQLAGNTATVVVQDAEGGRPIYVADDKAVRADSGGRRMVATGIYVLEPTVLAYIPRRTPFDIYEDLLPALWADECQVGVFENDGYWNPLETFLEYQEAQKAMLGSAQAAPEERRACNLPHYPEIQGTQIADGIWVGRNYVIHPAARLRPPVYIGDNCRIGAEVDLGPNAIIGSGVIVDDGATIEESTIIDHTYVGRLVKISRRIVQHETVVDQETGREITLVDDFLLAAVDPEQVGSRLQHLLDRTAALLLLWVMLPLLWLLSMVVLLTTGRLFVREHYYLSGVWQQPGAVPTVPLWHFYTRFPDGRYAGFGQWLERFDLHRLPELWNVVLGDLRLVGVKPLPPQVAGSIQDKWQEIRQQHPAGFTGLWYVKTDRQASLDEVLVTDAYYSATRNWQEDLRLLLQTPAGWYRRQQRTE